MKARDIMTRDPCFITPGDSVGMAASLMASRDVGIIPVVDSDGERHLLGVLTDRDIAVRHTAADHGPECNVGRHMSHGRMVTAHEGDDVHSVMGLMSQNHVRRVMVVDDDNHLVGVIAQADIARRVASDEPVTFERLMEALSEPAITA